MAVVSATRRLSDPSWTGIIAPRWRVARDQFGLWSALSMSLLVFVPGAYLVPALRLRDAIVVSLLASIAGGAMLGAVAWLAARQRMNTVGLLASTLGVPAGPVIASFLLVRHAIWAIFALAFAVNIAAQVPGLGGSRPLWAGAFGAIALALGLLPKRWFVERWIGWFSLWVGLVLIALVTLTGITTFGVPVLHDADGLGGWPTRGQGFDLIAAMPLLWLPVVADYAYDATSEREAALGTFAGSSVMTAWFAIVGVLWVFTVSARDVAGFMSALPIGAASVVVIVALQNNAVTANLYAASIAGGRFGYRYFRPTLIAVGVLAAVLVAGTDALGIQDVAQLLTAIFVPLFAVVLVRDVAGVRSVPLAWAAWGVGTLIYAWINPGDVAAWRNAVHFVSATVLHAPFPLGGALTPVPATLASAAAAAGIYVSGSFLSGSFPLRLARGAHG